MIRSLRLLFAALGLSWAAPASAEMVCFRYIPIDACGSMRLVPNGPNGSLASRYTGLMIVPEPFNRQFTPTHVVTFRHPVTNQNVTVPLTMPEGTPRCEYRFDRIIYNYGSYVVEARFLTDGSVEAVYNSGFLSTLQVR